MINDTNVVFKDLISEMKDHGYLDANTEYKQFRYREYKDGDEGDIIWVTTEDDGTATKKEVMSDLNIKYEMVTIPETKTKWSKDVSEEKEIELLKDDGKFSRASITEIIKMFDQGSRVKKLRVPIKIGNLWTNDNVLTTMCSWHGIAVSIARVSSDDNDNKGAVREHTSSIKKMSFEKFVDSCYKTTIEGRKYLSPFEQAMTYEMTHNEIAVLTRPKESSARSNAQQGAINSLWTVVKGIIESISKALMVAILVTLSYIDGGMHDFALKTAGKVGRFINKVTT